MLNKWLPWWASMVAQLGKESTCNAGEPGSIPALVGSLPRVDTIVFDEIRSLTEASPAFITFIRLLTCVGPLVLS